MDDNGGYNNKEGEEQDEANELEEEEDDVGDGVLFRVRAVADWSAEDAEEEMELFRALLQGSGYTEVVV